MNLIRLRFVFAIGSLIFVVSNSSQAQNSPSVTQSYLNQLRDAVSEPATEVDELESAISAALNSASLQLALSHPTPSTFLSNGSSTVCCYPSDLGAYIPEPPVPAWQEPWRWHCESLPDSSDRWGYVHTNQGGTVFPGFYGVLGHNYTGHNTLFLFYDEVEVGVCFTF